MILGTAFIFGPEAFALVVVAGADVLAGASGLSNVVGLLAVSSAGGAFFGLVLAQLVKKSAMMAQMDNILYLCLFMVFPHFLLALTVLRYIVKYYETSDTGKQPQSKNKTLWLYWKFMFYIFVLIEYMPIRRFAHQS